jgi:hypothetical protein
MSKNKRVPVAWEVSSLALYRADQLPVLPYWLTGKVLNYNESSALWMFLFFLDGGRGTNL